MTSLLITELAVLLIFVLKFIIFVKTWPAHVKKARILSVNLDQKFPHFSRLSEPESTPATSATDQNLFPYSLSVTATLTAKIAVGAKAC